MSAAGIIPVYNEAERLVPAIGATLGCLKLDEVIVVDDGSTDGTAERLRDFEPAITLATHDENRGKGTALDTGVHHARSHGHDRAVFLDADLRGIRPEHVSMLLEPLERNAIMTIGYLGCRTEFQKRILNRWGALSGQRGLLLEYWGLLSDKDREGFNVEAALNARLREKHLHPWIERVELPGVSHAGKREKTDSLGAAVGAYAKTYGSALMTYLRIGLGG